MEKLPGDLLATAVLSILTVLHPGAADCIFVGQDTSWPGNGPFSARVHSYSCTLPEEGRP
jgi:hypothetical protein